MKTFIFRASESVEFFHIEAASSMLAIRELVAKHGKRPYVIVAIT